MGDPSADDEGGRSQPAMRSALSLRPYQHEAVDAVQAAVDRGVQRPMVVLPTGCGKTVLFAALIARRGGSALVLAHRDELLRQAAEKIAIADPTLALGVGFVAAQRDDVGSPVVVGSVQTLARANRLARLPKQFDTVVVDEAHHASARSYRRILEYLSPSPLILGVTATPTRADGKQLGDVWQEIVYQRGIAEMIRAGYLADIRGVRVGLEQVKLDEVEQSGGDFDADALGKVLEQASAPLHVLTAYRQHATGRKAIVFVPTVALAHRMATVFREAGIRAEALDGKTPWEQRRGDPRATAHRGDTRRRQRGGALRRRRRPLGRRGDHGHPNPLAGEIHTVRRPRATDVPRQGGLSGDRCGRCVRAARPANAAAAVQPARRARARGDSHRGARARAAGEDERSTAAGRWSARRPTSKPQPPGGGTPDGELRSRPVSMLAAREAGPVRIAVDLRLALSPCRRSRSRPCSTARRSSTRCRGSGSSRT